MLECAIPGCNAKEKFLRSGQLHLLDVANENGLIAKKMVWFCSNCSAEYTVQLWRAPGKQIRRRNASPMFDVYVVLSATPESAIHSGDLSRGRMSQIP
jgi:hypothetical protein